MSLPSDNKDIKKQEEPVSNEESSSDDSNEVGQDGKKEKRQLKKLSKPAGHLEEEKLSPGTSNNSKTGKNENESEVAGCSGENAGSTSGDKNVGEVREDIEQLKLNEEMATIPKEPIKQLQASPGISSPSKQGAQPSGSTTSTENVTKTKTDEPDVPAIEEDVLSLPPSEFEIQEYAPPNTLNDDTDEMSQGLGANYPPSKAGAKRMEFAENAENTLDDISEIPTDSISEPQTDSSSWLQSETHPSQQDTLPLDETDNFSVSEYKTVKSVLQDDESSEELPEKQKGASRSSNEDASEYKTAKDGDSTSQSSSKGPNVSSAQENEEDTKDDSSKSGGAAEELGGEDGSNEAVPNAEGGCMDDQGGSDMEVVEEPGAPVDDPPSLDGQNVNIAEPEHEGNLGELVVREEMDDPIHDPDNLGAQGGVDDQHGGNEPESDQDGSSEQDSSENRNLVDMLFAQNPLTDSSTSTPDSGISNSAALFLRDDNYEMAPYEVPEAFQENSETNSSLGSSELAGLNNLQGWVGAGDHANAPQPVPPVAPNQPVPPVAPNQPVPQAAPNQPLQLNEGLGINAPNDQSLPSTSSGNQPNLPRPNAVHFAKPQLLNVPMECAEHFEYPTFDEKEVPTQQSGEVLETSPDTPNVESLSNETMEGALGQRPIPSESDPGREGIPGDVEDANANQGDEGVSKKGPSPTTLNPKTGQCTVGDDSKQLSGESLEHSRGGSLADMDDAIESSERSISEGNVLLPGDSKKDSKVLRSDERPLLVGPKVTRSSSRFDERPLLVGPKQVENKPSQKRLAKKNPDKKLKKKRKANTGSCRLQAHLNVDDKMETSSSEEDPKPEKEITIQSTSL